MDDDDGDGGKREEEKWRLWFDSFIDIVEWSETQFIIFVIKKLLLIFNLEQQLQDNNSPAAAADKRVKGSVVKLGLI
jgi:hypothetical protein